MKERGAQSNKKKKREESEKQNGAEYGMENRALSKIGKKKEPKTRERKGIKQEEW